MNPLVEQILAGVAIRGFTGLWGMIPWKELLKKIKPPKPPADPKDKSASSSNSKDSPHPEAQHEEP